MSPKERPLEISSFGEKNFSFLLHRPFFKEHSYLWKIFYALCRSLIILRKVLHSSANILLAFGQGLAGVWAKNLQFWANLNKCFRQIRTFSNLRGNFSNNIMGYDCFMESYVVMSLKKAIYCNFRMGTSC